MDLHSIATDVLNRLLDSKTHYRNPIRDCLAEYLAKRNITLTEDETDEVVQIVLDFLRMLARRR